MRMTVLLVLLVCLNLGNAMLASLGIFPTSPVAYEGGIIETINETAQGQYLASNVQSQESQTIGFGDFVTSLFLFTKIFVMGLVLPFKMLQNFGVPATLALWVSFPIYLIYLIAIIQFISGRILE